jgi:hypothetical protein
MKIEISSIPSGFIRNTQRENVMCGVTVRRFYLETTKAFAAYISSGAVYWYLDGLEILLEFLQEKEETKTKEG